MINPCRTWMGSLLLPVCFLSLVTAACGGDSPTAAPTPQPAPTQVQVTPQNPVVREGEVVTFSATVLDQQGRAMTGVAITWSIAPAAVGTISPTGQVTAAESGTATVTATAGSASGNTSLNVEEAVVQVVLSAADSSLIVGQTGTLTAAALDNEGEDVSGRAVTWASTDPAVLTVDASGGISAVAEGSAQVTATVDGVEGSLTIDVVVNPVLPTSWENFNTSGYLPVDIPLGATSTYFGVNEEAHAFGDFFDRGAGIQDLFTASVVYDPSQETEAQAGRSVLRFWRNEGGVFVEDNSILQASIPSCLHPRRALVADYNLDARPDVFLICHGYDQAPFPGEPNQVLLSGPSGYELVEAAPDVGFWHGGAAADLTGDGYPDVVASIAGQQGYFENDGTGRFNFVASSTIPVSANTGYYNLDLLDVNEDGLVDVLMGGHEWESPTRIWINPGDNDFASTTPITIPAVDGLGIVAGFAVSGTGSTRAVWVLRTGGAADFSRFYDYPVIQRYDLTTGTASVVAQGGVNDKWAAFLMVYERNGQTYVGSSDLRRPIEYLIP